METPRLQIAYLSRATESFNHQDLFDLIDQAKNRNKEAGICGILVYNSGIFLQLLEGDELAVRSLVEKISKDSRHTDFKIIFENFAGKTIFADWYMAYKNLNDYQPKLRRTIDIMLSQSREHSQEDFLQILRYMRQEF